MNQPSPPYAFAGNYSECLVDYLTAMDRRHIYLMHEILCAWPFKSALEIGSYWGASGTAFVEAINKGAAMRVVFCDITPTPNLIRVADACKDRSRATVFKGPSTAVLDSGHDFDFIFVDGNHDLASVKPEIEHLMRRRPVCVMAHDTHATAAGYAMSDGAQALKKKFVADAEYLCLEDYMKRDGEMTERGLFFATTNPELFNIASGIFNKWK